MGENNVVSWSVFKCLMFTSINLMSYKPSLCGGDDGVEVIGWERSMVQIWRSRSSLTFSSKVIPLATQHQPLEHCRLWNENNVKQGRLSVVLIWFYLATAKVICRFLQCISHFSFSSRVIMARSALLCLLCLSGERMKSNCEKMGILLLYITR